MFELKKGVGASDRTLAVTFSFVQAFWTHRVVACKLVDVWRVKIMALATAGGTRLVDVAARTCDELLLSLEGIR